MLTATSKPQSQQVEFRCDNMQIDWHRLSQHHNVAAICQNHVVFKLDNLWMCCNTLSATLHKNGQWQNLRCNHQVRVWREDLQIWADQAMLDHNTQHLMLLGNLLLYRPPQFWLRSQQVDINLQDHSLSMRKPQAQSLKDLSLPIPKAFVPTTLTTLPAYCPLDDVPNHAPVPKP